MTKDCCENCKFFDEASSDLRIGRCRRKSPLHLVGQVRKLTKDDFISRGLWPIVNKDDWCGEFEKKK